ncbi:hypothetical protein ACLQ2Y_14120 [Micromonospora echinospora]|uniref:hypothetical protein n=1 Tax=Micromonospora echinospora TaxID=1877 RepID=UPI003CF1D427
MNPVGRESAAHRRREAADVEAHLVDVLRGTHPVRIGAVLRRMEAEVGARYPAAEAARLLERVIVVAVNSFSASAREVPTVEERVDDPAPGRRGAGRDHVIHHRR